MSMEYDERDRYRSPMGVLWEENYPFDYWQNRIWKINPYNPQDKLEALYVLLDLADTYATVLAAKLINPYEPWYMIVDNLPTPKIHETLDTLKVETEQGEHIELSMLEQHPDALMNYNIKDEWEDVASPFDLMALDLLGCPAEIDSEEKSIEFIEPPEDYVAICNGIVTFWKEHSQVLNDLKHGFRLLPFDRDTFESLIEIGLLQASDVGLEEKLEEYQKTKDEYLYFWRLEVDESAEPEEYEGKEDMNIGLKLVVYRTDAMRCRDIAINVLRLLENLLGRGGERKVVESMEELVGGQGDSIPFLEVFMGGELVYTIAEPKEEHTDSLG